MSVNLRVEFYESYFVQIDSNLPNLIRNTPHVFAEIIRAYCLRRLARDPEVRNLVSKIENREDCISASACAAYFNIQLENAEAPVRRDRRHR